MNATNYLTYTWTALVTAIIAGKWALDLGFSQPRQLLWMIAGFLVPPLALLILYARLARKHEPAGGDRVAGLETHRAFPVQ